MPARHREIIDVFAAGDWWRAELVVAEHWNETAAQFKRLEAYPREMRRNGNDGHNSDDGHE
jgi:hypothetical protein